MLLFIYYYYVVTLLCCFSFVFYLSILFVITTDIKGKICKYRMLSEEESNERFEDADENEDGKVTWDEYKADSYGIDDSSEENIIQTSEEDIVSCFHCSLKLINIKLILRAKYV